MAVIGAGLMGCADSLSGCQLITAGCITFVSSLKFQFFSFTYSDIRSILGFSVLFKDTFILTKTNLDMSLMIYCNELMMG